MPTNNTLTLNLGAMGPDTNTSADTFPIAKGMTLLDCSSGGVLIPVDLPNSPDLTQLSITYTSAVTNLEKTITYDQMFAPVTLTVPNNDESNQSVIASYKNSLASALNTIWTKPAYGAGEYPGPILFNAISSSSLGLTSPTSVIYINPSLLSPTHACINSYPPGYGLTWHMDYYYYWYTTIICGPPITYGIKVLRNFNFWQPC